MPDAPSMTREEVARRFCAKLIGCCICAFDARSETCLSRLADADAILAQVEWSEVIAAPDILGELDA